jgi:DNA-binding transcriptional MerR regulator
MNIKNFSKLSGISSHTIRYYEKLGLLRSVQRNASGYRDFNNDDLIWLEFIKRLKDTAMPLKDIQTYARLRFEGETTQELRMDILKKHAMQLEEKIKSEKDHLKKLKLKIAHYEKLMITQ